MMVFGFDFVNVIVLLLLGIASIQDIRFREVYDVLTIGFLFFSFGFRIIGSFFFGWQFLASGLLGFLLFLSVALFLYYSSQWGGADSKLLMGMGMFIGFDRLFSFLLLGQYGGYDLLLFFGLVLFVGALWSLLFSVYLAAIHWSDFWSSFVKGFLSQKRYAFLSLGLFAFCLVLGLLFDWSFVFFGALIFLLYLLLLFITSVEKSCFVIDKKIKDLVPGDWLSEDISKGSLKLAPKTTLEEKDLVKLRKVFAPHNTILIKEGVPFVPSFFISYLLLLFGQKLFLWIGTVLF